MRGERDTWAAMRKFAAGQLLTEREWIALSWLSLIDRDQREFRPGNVRWAKDETERADNIAFYKSLSEAAP
jgi:hypothetical protein